MAIEVGPKGRRVAAWAVGWPGLERGGPSPEAALTRLEEYRERYEAVARNAGRLEEFTATGPLRIVVNYPGIGSTDFWGISFASCALDEAPIDSDELARRLELLAAAWRFFDEVRAGVTAQLAKGPRGGGRDREEIARHVLACEQDWARKVGVAADGDLVADAAALTRHRHEFLHGVSRYHAEGRRARTWTLPFLVRHTAFHVLDHAWEMQDKDLSAIQH
ncbi:MAG: hypothetical protein ACYCPK_02770 [Acidimicrobiales bacterium]